MSIKELKEVKKVQMNPELEKYRGKVLFPEKLAAANKILSKAPLPSKPKS